MLLGMTGGYAAGWLLGAIGDTEWSRVAAAPVFALPAFGHHGWSFDPALAIPFAIAAIAASLKAMGNVTTCQKMNDAGWVRPDMQSIGRGVTADGLGSLVSGLLGGHGLNSSTPVVGLSNATGITSRSVAWPVAGILLALAFVPKIGLVLSTMPKAVVGAALVFSSTFIIINGMEIMTSRLLDVRKTLVIGTAIVFGLAVEMNPHLLRILPPAARAALGSSIVVGTLVGLLLNVLLRIGVRRTATIEVEPGASDTAKALEEFIEAQGAAWGARRDVIERAKFNLAQSIETIASIGVVNGVLEVGGVLRRIPARPARVVRRPAARAARQAPHERGDHGVRGRRAAAGRVHAAPARGPRVGFAERAAARRSCSTSTTKLTACRTAELRWLSTTAACDREAPAVNGMRPRKLRRKGDGLGLADSSHAMSVTK